MIENCIKCDNQMPDERVHLGYRECVECSSVQPYQAHVVYPHKTGAFVQPVTQEQKENLNRLDRRAVKTSNRLGTSRLSGYDTLVRTDTKPEHRDLPPRPAPKYNHTSFNDSFKPTINTYKRKGYIVTINYLKQLFKKNRINMITKNNLVNTLTTIHMMDRKTRKRYLNGIT